MNIRDSNGGTGTIYIEVPCFDWICNHQAWFDVFYEHVNYFRVSDFGRIFGRVYESGHLFSGQYLYVVADLATVQKPAYASSSSFVLPADFLGTVDQFAGRLKTTRTKKRSSVVWGGASKGVVYTLFMQRAGAEIDYVIDINPAKQGKYLPATGIRVFSPEEVLPQLGSGSGILVMNSNYLEEIRKLTGNRFILYSVDRE